MKTHQIDSNTDLYCIVGSPVRHSLSPVIHNTAFQKNGINAVYLAFEPSSIESAVESIRSLGIKGASVTIPFKIDVLRYVDEADPLASAIGSVNTLVNADGKIIGHNTDGYGAIRALANNKINVENSRILLIGNGGSARALAYTLLQNGASVMLGGRNLARVEGLARDLEKKYRKVRSLLIGDLDRKHMESVDVIINTTPVGMAPDTDSMPIPDALLLKRHAVFDIVYSPLKTKLLDAAQKKGCAVVNGIEMLIFQGARQFELWTGKPAPIDAIYSAITSRLHA